MRGLFFVIAALALVGCAPQARGPDEAAMIEGARALDQSFVTAFNSGDAAGATAAYASTPDVVLMSPDGTVSGIDAIRQSWETAFANGPGPQLELYDYQYKVAGDHVIAWGKFRMNVGGGQVLEGRTTEVMTQENGRWVYVLDHASVPMPSPPPTPAPAGAAAAHGG